MSKDEMVAFLKKNGYNVKNISGVVYIFYPEGISDYTEYIAKVENDIRESGFSYSWGCKYSKDESARYETVETAAEE